jgi:hypothetical protein
VRRGRGVDDSRGRGLRSQRYDPRTTCNELTFLRAFCTSSIFDMSPV